MVDYKASADTTIFTQNDWHTSCAHPAEYISTSTRNVVVLAHLCTGWHLLIGTVLRSMGKERSVNYYHTLQALCYHSLPGVKCLTHKKVNVLNDHILFIM